MTHSITSQETSSLQLLQAQKAFKTKTQSANLGDFSSNIPVDEAVLSNGKIIKGSSNSINSQKTTSMSNVAKFNEINMVAKQVGYVGLTESQIQRALNLGESLLANYQA